MIAIRKAKKVYYLLRQYGADNGQTVLKKEELVRQGYLVITFIEGNENMQQGLREIVRNHIP